MTKWPYPSHPKGDRVGNDCRARVHENPGRRLLGPSCRQQQGSKIFGFFPRKLFFSLFPSSTFFVDKCQPSSLGFGQWVRAAWWGVEPRWQQVHHGHREGAWQKAIIGKLFSATIDIISLHKRWLFLMRMTWFQLHPSDPVRPAPWVQNVVALSV